MTWAELYAVLRDRGLLVAGAEASAPTAQTSVSGIAYDSRHVQPGDVFVALRGQHADGVAFAADAVTRGAVAVLAQESAPENIAVPWAQVSNARLALAAIAIAANHDPSRRMQVVGITGTNGKTTTAHLIASIFEAAGIRSGLLGTVAYRIGNQSRPATRTTPEAPDVQALLAEMVAKGCGACAMEVSSHALALGRVEGMHFAAATFTNLTRDHLDFHADMEDYFQAKTPHGVLRLRSALVGRPNVYNILAAVATAIALDIPNEAIETGIAALDRVPGRFQVVSAPTDDVNVVVDYAHTDDALKNLLETARPLTTGRIITVFGCGGDRDRTKRPLMGAVAGRLSDVIIITSDNPRTEDPVRIIEEIQRGITPDTRRNTAQSTVAVVDRRQAIERAIDMAVAGDLVLVAGKGHEKYQTIGSQTLPFDDVEVARAALSRRRTRQGVR